MKNIILLLGIFFFISINAQSPEELKAWQEYMTPSDTHIMMAKDIGEWDADITMWMTPDSEATKSKGKMKIEMLMDGKYQASEYSSEVMGMPMQGRSLLAYDNAKKEFISTWIDNFGTGIMILKGNWVEKGKLIELEGFMVDPMNGNDIKVREKYHFIDENTQKMQMFYEMGEKEYMNMEIVFTRTTMESKK